MNNEKALRELIKKIADYQKPKPVEYTYNFEKLTLDHEGDLTDDDYKKIVVEQFLKKNYTTTDWSKLANAYSKSATVLSGNNANTYNLTPAAGTSGLNIYTGDKQAGGVTSVGIDSSGDLVVRGWKAGSTDSHAEELIRIKKADLFTPKPKDQTSTPSADDLKKFKEQAKELINRNPKLTDKQKEDYKKQIENATTKEQIQNILKQANDQAGKNNVKPEDIKKKEKEEKEKRENEQKEKDKKEREKKQEEQTTKDKKSANDTIDGLSDLTQDEKDKLKEKLNGKSGDTSKSGAKTPEEVQQIVNEAQARNAARKAIKDELPFLDHGTGAEGKTDTTHADDAALNELLGTKSGKDSTLTDLETALAKTNPAATAEEIKNALDTDKRQNAINEENAKNSGLAKLDALLQQLTDAENGLNETQKEAVKQKVEAAKTAINGAKDTVNKATKPSDIKTAVDGVKIEDALKEINTQVTNAQQNNKQQQENENKDALANEKKEQIARINASNLSDADKQKAIDDINNAKKLGDPTGIADRALKAKKIADALAAIDKLGHLNNAQKQAYKDIINGTAAKNHVDDKGKDTGVDDIDDALANAINTDNAMARLEELKVIADKFAKGDAYKNSNDANKKKAFDGASTAAGAVLDKAKGDPKDADQVNELYKDLLKAMQDLDNTVKGAGVKTDALAAEIDSDKNLKPSETDPKTPGDSVYNTSSKDKKEAFDKALKDAEAALQTANSDNEDAKKPTSTPLTPDQEAQKQKAVDDALDKLIKARLALDGVNTKPLQDEIDKNNKVKNSDKYTYSTKEKQTAFDTALSEANELIKKLTGAADQQAQPGQGTQQPDLSTKEAKQKALDAALKKLQDAAKALDGTKPIEPTPTPSPLPTPGDGTGAGTDNTGSGNAGSGNAGSGNAGSGSEAGYGVNDNAPTIVDKGELNIQIDSAETDSKPGNAGAGNANAGSATGAQGGAGTSSGSGMGTGTAGAANAGVDNKAVNNAVENAPEVKQADAAVKQAAATLDEALAQAKRVAADPHATQAQVDAAAVKLADARKALADAQANAAKVRAAVRSRVIKGMRSRGNAGVAAGADVATAGLMATMIAAIGGAFVTRRMRAMHANRD
ncbi:GA module-containing protein [Gardnerella vaginalis]|uniref:GA module-containing protein n=1 Tax=Gardnerella vaginalis TaxID=2702 RepID=UPI0006C161C8|nr:GA module-containing protein [Gardnerella vaginalis]KOS09542.1 peptidase [Gardnerella vaginalis]